MSETLTLDYLVSVTIPWRAEDITNADGEALDAAVTSATGEILGLLSRHTDIDSARLVVRVGFDVLRHDFLERGTK